MGPERTPPPRPTGRVTIDRLLSKLGVASRTTAREHVAEGRVRINGRVVRNPGTWVTWPGDTVLLDGKSVHEAPPRFFLFHKPRGVITTRKDEKGRRTIFDVLPPEFLSVNAVGRLDQATSGLLLLTNDTELAGFLTDPVHGIPRTYLLTVEGLFTPEAAARAVTGVTDREEHLACSSVDIQKSSGRESHLCVVLSEGKNRELRRLFAALGHPVTRLRRVEFGPFKLGDLQPGQWREIPMDEARRVLLIRVP